MPSENNMQGRLNDPAFITEEDNGELEIDLVELMYRMLEKIKWIIAFALVGMIVAGLYTKFCVTPMYEAKTKLYVQESKNNVVDLSSINLADKLTADYMQVFNNWHVHEMVITSLDLPYSYRSIQRMISVDILENSRILELTVTSADPREAYNIAMAYAQIAPAFIEAKMETSRPNIFEEARIPTKPSSPNMTINVLLGTFLGAAIAIAIIFVQFVSDDRVRNAEMLQKRLGLATLGMMPVQDAAGSDNVKRNGKGAKKA